MADNEKDLQPRLREHRLHRAMTQHDVAERLVRLAWIRCSRRVGVNADMISKWERGEKRPSRFYLRLICALFEATPSQLGLSGGPASIGAGTVTLGVVPPASDVTHVWEVLDDMHDAVELLQPKMLSYGGKSC